MVYPHSYRTEHSETKTSNSIYGEYYARTISKKIPIQPDLRKILQYVDSHRVKFVQDLNEVVKIRSISGELKYRNQVIEMIKFTEKWLIRLGMKYECFNVGYHELDGQSMRLPPIILASLGNDPNKKTVCVYSNLDVKRPREDQWLVNPWEVTEVDKCLYGCGVAVGKGPLLCWFHVVQAFHKSGIELPVNLKFIIQSMHEQESLGLKEFLATRKQDFFYNVDYVIVCDSEWLGDKYPCVTYGSVGILHFDVTIEKTASSNSEPKDDMVKIFEKIADDEENILIPNFNNYVQQITPDEEKLYEAIEDFNPDDLKDTLPPFKQKWDKVNLLMHFWRLPSILVDDTEECVCEKKDLTKVKRHFMIKIVPRQIVDNATKETIQHINSVSKELKIENKVSCQVLSTSRPWVEDIRHPNYEAARRATIQIYKEDPSMIREDRDMKVITILSRIIEKNIVLLPLGNKSINARQENENISLRNFFEGTKLLGAYLFQASYQHD